MFLRCRKQNWILLPAPKMFLRCRKQNWTLFWASKQRVITPRLFAKKFTVADRVLRSYLTKWRCPRAVHDYIYSLSLSPPEPAEYIYFVWTFTKCRCNPQRRFLYQHIFNSARCAYYFIFEFIYITRVKQIKQCYNLFYLSLFIVWSHVTVSHHHSPSSSVVHKHWVFFKGSIRWLAQQSKQRSIPIPIPLASLLTSPGVSISDVTKLDSSITQIIDSCRSNNNWVSKWGGMSLNLIG